MQYLTPEKEFSIIDNSDFNQIIGIDEVGRGCIAGPVAVGYHMFSIEDQVLDGVHDSKKLSAGKRGEAHKALQLKEGGVLYGSVYEVDNFGIAEVIEELIGSIIKYYQSSKTLFLIDGRFKRNFGKNTRQVIKGDMNYYSIACASIRAKVERDAIMNHFSLEYRGYGFESHKGYGTKKHIDAVTKLGVTPIHRRSYKPISDLV